MGKVICFDLRPLQIGHENRGIGMVIKSILENLVDEENAYIFYTFDNSNPLEKLSITPKISNYKIISTHSLNTEVKKLSDILDSFKMTFHKFRNIKKYKPDIFVQFDFTLGLPKFKNTKTITIAYDLIPLIMRNDYLPTPYFAWNHTTGKKAKVKSALKAVYYNIRYKIYYLNYKKSDEIISISDYTTKSFVDLLKIVPSKIKTIPLAPVSSSDTLDASILIKINKPFIFYIGGTDKRKHINHVIYAFNIVRSRGFDIQLVLAGNEFKNQKTIPDDKTRDAICASPYKEDIICMGFVTDSEKNSLYKAAHAFVFCSANEGFGLPIIEAEANSCPVVAYNNSSIPEAAGNAALLVESGNYIDAAEKVIDLFDNNNREDCIKKGLKYSKKFSWDLYTRSFYNLISC